jgi:thiamine-phosphate pyrophosphorylase
VTAPSPFTLPSHFYAIADPAGGHNPIDLAATLLAAGARILQLRLKEVSSREFVAAATEIAKLCRASGAIFIVNDRADIATLVQADGVHLGQNDLPLEAGRRVMPPGTIIGVSTHTIDQAREAEAGGADYIGFGPMYPGGLKNITSGQGLDKLRAVRAAVKIPIVAIGGITEQRVPEILRAGADAAAIITDVNRAGDSNAISAKVRAILALAR